jgi:hypothetical protein
LTRYVSNPRKPAPADELDRWVIAQGGREMSPKEEQRLRALGQDGMPGGFIARLLKRIRNRLTHGN